MTSTASTTYQNSIEAKLITAIGTGTTTGITLKIKQINGVTPTHPTAAHRLHIIQRTALVTKHEVFGVAAGTTQSGQTVTLGTVTRALPLDDGTDFTGSGTAQSFSAGADVFLSWDAHDAAQSAKLDLANTFTAAQTFSAPAIVSGTSSYVKVPSLTEAQRDALSASNGMIVYVTDGSNANRLHTYEGGAWGVSSSSTVDDAADAVAGKVDIASATEIGAGTATDATSGAVNVIPVSQTVKTSSGAGDENKIAVLNASGQFAAGFVDLSPVAGVPTGALFQWLTNTAPTGYLLCYGQVVSTTTYAALYAVIAHTFASDPGGGNFTLPDLRGRLPLGQDDMGGSSANRVVSAQADSLGGVDGAETVTLDTTMIPAHTHVMGTYGNTGGGQSGLRGSSVSDITSYTSTASTGGGLAHNNMPPYITVNYIIKT